MKTETTKLTLTPRRFKKVARKMAAHFDSELPELLKALTLELATHTLCAVQKEDASPAEVAAWHKILLEHLKAGIPAGRANGVENWQERAWDIFGVPEIERAKRRGEPRR